MKLSHSGCLGDILFAIPYCLSLLDHNGETEAEFNLQIKVKADYGSKRHPYGNVRLTQKVAEMLVPLLEIQPWVKRVTISDQIPKDSFNLDAFRSLNQNLTYGSISQWYYPIVPEITEFKSLHLPWIQNVGADERSRDKIVVFRSSRYHGKNVNLTSLKKYRDQLLFIGLEEEHSEFKNRVCDCEYFKGKDFLELASIINSSRLVIGNQTGLFSITEALKVDRCLEICFDCPNVVMSGGRFFPIVSEGQLEIVLGSLLDK